MEGEEKTDRSQEIDFCTLGMFIIGKRYDYYLVDAVHSTCSSVSLSYIEIFPTNSTIFDMQMMETDFLWQEKLLSDI